MWPYKKPYKVIEGDYDLWSVHDKSILPLSEAHRRTVVYLRKQKVGNDVEDLANEIMVTMWHDDAFDWARVNRMMWAHKKAVARDPLQTNVNLSWLTHDLTPDLDVEAKEVMVNLLDDVLQAWDHDEPRAALYRSAMTYLVGGEIGLEALYADLSRQSLRKMRDKVRALLEKLYERQETSND